MSTRRRVVRMLGIALTAALLGRSLPDAFGERGDAAPAASAPVALDRDTSATQPAADAQSANWRIHNVHRVSRGLFSGPAPEGGRDFDDIAAHGIRTIISVDGAAPDAASAAARGIRTVHLPIGYDGMSDARRLELARAVRDLPRPIYLHCHHGKHRGPAAAAAAAVLLNDLTAADGLALLRRAGTSPHYTGLYRCVADARPARAAELDAASNDFPPRAETPAFVQAMVEAQEALDRLELLSKTDWKAPPDHPDLRAAAESSRLADLMRDLCNDPRVSREAADFPVLMERSSAAAAQLETVLTARDAPQPDAGRRFAAVGESCKACHVQHRDRAEKL